jgi:hypothetical protein
MVKDFKFGNREKLLPQVHARDVVDRHFMDDDALPLFNQPSLHKS